MTGKSAGIFLILTALLFPLAGNVLALSTEELLRLKKTGVPEEIIVFMVEAGYNDADKVCRLKEAGFKDQNLLAIIRSETARTVAGVPPAVENNAEVPEKAIFETGGRIKILWYLLSRGEPVLQNRQAVEDARILLVGDNVVKFEWKAKDELGVLEVFRRKAFATPFYWEIGPDDTLEPGKEGYAWALTSAADHRGRPVTDGKHYWVVYFDPKDTGIVDLLKKNLPGK